jgi:hypothetical protein
MAELLVGAAALAACGAWLMVALHAVRAWRAGHRGLGLLMDGLRFLDAARAPGAAAPHVRAMQLRFGLLFALAVLAAVVGALSARAGSP